MAVEPQTYVNTKLAWEVKDRLISSGLFTSAKVRKRTNRDGTCDLRVVVSEKQLWFVFPIFQAWSGRYSGGAAFGESNLFSPNSRTLLTAQGGNKMLRFFGVVDANNLFDTDFALRTYVLYRSDDVPIYQGVNKTDEIRLKEGGFSFLPGYQWTREIRTSLGVHYRYVDYGISQSVALSGTTGNDVSLEFDFVFDSLKRKDAFANGDRIRASFRIADSRFGTDFSYHQQEVEWVRARTYGKYVNHVIQLIGAIGDQARPFHRDFTLGGNALRGFNDRQFRGDTKVVARQNLLAPIVQLKKFSVFGLAFYDLGLLYRDNNGLKRENFRNGIGAGFRVSLKNILAPVVGVDFGYGIEDQDYHIYMSLGLVRF